MWLTLSSFAILIQHGYSSATASTLEIPAFNLVACRYCHYVKVGMQVLLQRRLDNSGPPHTVLI